MGPELGLITLSSSLLIIVPLLPSPLLLPRTFFPSTSRKCVVLQVSLVTGVMYNFKRTEYEKELEIKYLRINFIIKIAGTTLVVSVGKTLLPMQGAQVQFLARELDPVYCN